MQAKINKYIANEKELARFNIRRLQKRKSLEPSQRRLKEIEEEFVSLPLEEYAFESVADVAAAIRIYRMSRGMFYKTYDIPKPRDLERSFIDKKLNKKIIFIQNLSNDLLNKRTKELNSVQDEEIFEDLAVFFASKERKTLPAAKTELSMLSHDKLLKIEPMVLAKKRARKQVVISSLGTLLSEICNNMPEGSSDEKINYLDRQISIIERKVFLYYNYSLDVLPDFISNTMGENRHLKKLHRLKNIFNFPQILKDISILPILSNKKDVFFERPFIENITLNGSRKHMHTYVSDRRKDSKHKNFGIMIPMQRIGNEKMTLLYSFISSNGINITRFFDRTVSNTKANSSVGICYFKSLMLQPLWCLIDMTPTKKEAAIFYPIIGHDLRKKEDFNNEKIVERVNAYKGSSLTIDEKSLCLVPRTRSEENAFNELLPWTKKKIDGVKREYMTTTNYNI